ncbi:hypothetical protein QJQ45_010504 [Haematococcus lacustris]|nr:hypothetical protein QJQ45_010504 [Haematococcus lacustris]
MTVSKSCPLGSTSGWTADEGNASPASFCPLSSIPRADGDSPTNETPPPSTRLLDLPPELLDDIACRVMQLGARSQLPLTCRTFSHAHLLHIPALRIQLGRQHCDQLLTPRIIATLRARRSKLALTFEPQTQTQIEALMYVLAHLGSCVAVDALKLCCRTSHFSPWPLDCTPELAQRLVDSFPGLTALGLHGFSVTCSGLASILSYPQLALQLQQLDLTRTAIQQPQQPGAGPVTLDNLFQGARLNQLSLYSHNIDEGEVLFPSLKPLAQHLTHLSLLDATPSSHTYCFQTVSAQRLAHLRELCVQSSGSLEGLPELLQALPQLHTLQLPGATVQDQHLDTLLAATQITSVQFGIVHGLDVPRADAPCSWQQLQVTRTMDCISAACLPLHSLTQPLNVKCLCIGEDDVSGANTAAAVLTLTQACQVPVTVGVLSVNVDFRSEGDRETGILLDDHVLLQQQRSHLRHWVAQLHALQHHGKGTLHPDYTRTPPSTLVPAAAADGTQQHCHPVAAAAWAWGKVEVSYLFAASAADVTALAPLCQACTRLTFRGGSIQATLEFWQQLVQLMPAVQQVTFWFVAGAATEAMCEALRLVAGQPWARWLDIKISALTSSHMARTPSKAVKGSSKASTSAAARPSKLVAAAKAYFKYQRGVARTSQRALAQQHGVSRSTLNRVISRGGTLPKQGRPTVLVPAEEKWLVSMVKGSQEQGQGVTKLALLAKHVFQAAAANDKQSLTCVAWGSADGQVLAPNYISAGTMLTADALGGVAFFPDSAIILKPGTHMMDGQLFPKLLVSMARQIPGGVSKRNRALLLLDGHGSRFSSETRDTAAALGFDMLIFPGQCTHFLQPWDQLFSSVKASHGKMVAGAAFHAGAEGFSPKLPQRISMVDSALHLSVGHSREPLKRAFAKTGLFPPNKKQMLEAAASSIKSGKQKTTHAAWKVLDVSPELVQAAVQRSATAQPLLYDRAVDRFYSKHELGLTSLALDGYFIRCNGLATLFSHPQLQQLDQTA